jgi:hypothetical protein
MIYKSTSNPRKLIMQSKLDENKKKENYEQQIKIKEKEIRNRQQLIDILEKDNKKLKDSWNSIDNIGKDGGNKIKEQLKIKNTEIIEIQNKIKEYKHIISEHAICEKKIEFLNKIIENKRKTIHSKISETAVKDNKNNELNTKLNMVDKALEQLEENRKQNKQKKLKLKQKNYSLSLPNDNKNQEQDELTLSNFFHTL